jgi:PucR C-terminal helix-turn-helix domain/GGDEF-like domain
MPGSDMETQIGQLRVALLDRCDHLGTMVAGTIRREVEYYRRDSPVSDDQLTESCVENMRFMFEGLDAPAKFDTAVAARTGTARAIAGVPLAAVMEAYRVGCRLVWEELVNEAAARPRIGREALIRATSRIWTAQDVYTQAMAGAYRDETNRKLLTQAAERAALVECVLEGRIVEQATLWEIASMLRLPSRGPYAVIAAECPSIGKAALPGIESKLSSIDIPSAWRLLPDVHLGLAHVRTDAKFDTLRQTIVRATATRAGISSRFDDLAQTPDAVTYARIALSSERVDGSLVGVFEDKPLTIAAISSPRVMKQIAKAVFAGFADLDEGERALLFTTFRTWMAADGSVNEAAERLFCHPNTVRHRLRRIEQRTGKSITRPRELAELCLAFEVDERLP